MELSTTRPLGFGNVGPIPFTEIYRYFKIYQLEDFHSFLSIIRIIDRQFLEGQRKRIENSTKDRSSKGSKASATGNSNTGRRNQGKD